MLAIELVSLHVGEHAVREADHLVICRALIVIGQQPAIIGDQPDALIAQPFNP